MLSFRGHHAGAQRLRAVQILDGDGCLRSEMLDQLGIERLELLRVAGRNLQHADETVARHQRRAQHRRFTDALAVGAVAAVVIEQSGKPAGRLIPPLPPVVAVPVEAVHLLRLQQRRRVIA